MPEQKISVDQVRHVAKLARLALDDAKLQKLAGQLEAILAGLPHNLFILSAHKYIPPVMEIVAEMPDSRIEGFLAAGHAATITGSGVFGAVR